MNFRRLGTCGPAIQAFPSFLAENKYQDITSNKKTAFQKGHNTELTAFEWMAQNPKQFGALQTVMTALQSNSWLEGFDLLNKAARSLPTDQPDKVFFVDVGGGHGHQAVQLQKRYPNLHGHLVLQDLPQIVNKLPPIDGVKAVPQDFFEKQAIEGESCYLRSSAESKRNFSY
jgi:demethylsterigmatocystin 6-O-methyltransferase